MRKNYTGLDSRASRPRVCLGVYLYAGPRANSTFLASGVLPLCEFRARTAAATTQCSYGTL